MKKTTSILLITTLLLSNIYIGGALSYANETNDTNIDWAQVNWNQETILLEDQKNYERKINELIETGKYEEAKALQIEKRKLHDQSVLETYQIPPVVKQVVQEHYQTEQGFQAQSANTKTLEEKIQEALDNQNSFTTFGVPTTTGNLETIPSPSGGGLGRGSNPSPDKGRLGGVLPTISLTKSIPSETAHIQTINTNGNILPGNKKEIEQEKNNGINLLSSDTLVIEYYEGITNNPTEFALYALASQQDENGLIAGSLTSTYEFINLLEKFRRTDNTNYQRATHYFKTTLPKNNLERIYKIQILAKLNEDYEAELNTLKQTQNTDGGFSIIPGYESDPYTSIKTLDLLVNINDPLMDGVFAYIEPQIQENGSINPFENAATPDAELSYELYQTLNKLPETTQAEAKIKLQTYLATLENSESLLEESLFGLTFEYDTEKQEAVQNLKQILPFSQSYNGTIYDTDTTLKSLELIAQSDIEVVSVTPSGTLKNGEPAKFNILIQNKGYKKTEDVNIHLFADNVYYGSQGHLAFSELQPNVAVEFTDFTIQNTANFKDEMKLDFYIETANESNSENNWIQQTHTFAPQDDNFPALPMYFVAHSHQSSDGLGINVRWPEKTDPDLDSYVVFYQVGNEAEEQITLDKLIFSNGAFINGFEEGEIVNISVGVKSIHDTNTIRRFANQTTFQITSKENEVLIPVNGQTLNLNIPTGQIELRSHGGTDISGYDGTYEALIQEGKNILEIDNPEYENLIYKINAVDGQNIENKNIITKLKADSEAPEMIDLEFLHNTPIKTGLTKEIFIGATDNIAVQAIDLYYYEPNAGYWIYETTLSPDNQVAVYDWNIPNTLLGTGYKLKAIAKDPRGNTSQALEYGPFEVLDGTGPSSSINITGLEDNKWKLGDTKEITWNLQNIENLESITSVTLYYGASNITITPEVDLENQSVTYAIPINSNYITDTAYITSRVCVNDNCSDAVSAPFEIYEEAYQVPTPWTPAEEVGFPMSGTNFTRGIEAVFRGENDDVEIIYSEQILPIGTSNAPYRIAYARKQNGTWQTPLTIREKTYSNTNYSYYGDIQAVKSGEEIHLVYSDVLGNSDEQRDATEIYYAKIKNNSVTELSQISNDNTYSSKGEIQIDENNNIHIIWKEGFSFVDWAGTSQTKYTQNLGTEQILLAESSSYPSITAQNGKLFVQYRQNDEYYFKEYDSSNNTWNQPIHVGGNGYLIESEIYNRNGTNIYDIFARASTAELSWKYYINHIKFDANTGDILLNKTVTSPTELEDIKAFQVDSKGNNNYHISYTNKIIEENKNKLYYTHYQDAVIDNYLLTTPSMNVGESYVFGNKVKEKYIVDYGGYLGGAYHLFQIAGDFGQTEEFNLSDLDIDFDISLQEFRINFNHSGYKFSLWIELFG